MIEEQRFRSRRVTGAVLGCCLVACGAIVTLVLVAAGDDSEVPPMTRAASPDSSIVAREPFSPSDEQRLLDLAFRDARVSSVLNGRGAVVASSQPSGPAAILFLALPNEVELKGPWVVEDTNAMVAKRLGKSTAEVGVLSSEDVSRVLSDIRPSDIVTMTVNEKHNVTQIMLVVDSESGVVRRFYPAVTPPTVDPRSIPAGSSPTSR